MSEVLTDSEGLGAYERAALAAVTAHPELLPELQPGDITSPENRIYLALLHECRSLGLQPEPAVLHDLALKTGRHELTGLMIFDIANTEFIRANFTYYVSKLHQRALQQQILSGASALVDRIRRNGEDPRDALADFWEQTRAIEAEPTPPAIGCPFLPLSSLLSVPDEPLAYLVDGFLVADANGWIGGEPKSLKSWLALYLALCISLGIPVFNRYAVPAVARVLYIQEEDGARRVRRRIRKILRGLGMGAPSDDFFRYSIKAGILLDDDRWLDILKAEIAEYRPALVILDVFENMHTRDSNDRGELKPILYGLDRVHEEFRCGFLLVDHFKKSTIGASKRGGQRLSGSVGKHAWGESSIYLFQGASKGKVRVETEAKDGPEEIFNLTLDDTLDDGVEFRWEAAEDEKTIEMKAGILEIMSREWTTAKTVAEAVGVSTNTASKYLNILTDEDGKLERERRDVGKVKPWHWRLRA